MVLVIDDSEYIHDFIAFILSRAGFPVLSARSGEDGIRQFQAHQAEIDMVLLDLQMPGMGGVATFHQLHKMDPTLPIIIFSALDSAEVRQLFPTH
jgi:hypothetical protein